MQNKTVATKMQMHGGKYRKRHKSRLYVLLALTALICGACLLEAHIRPILRAVVEYESRNYAISSFNEAIAAHLAQNPDAYEDLYTVTWDADGVPTSVVANSYEINCVRSELTQQVLKSLLENKETVYSFHLGRLTGVQMFASSGAMISLEIEPDTYIISNIYSTLEEAGENQTLLSVYVSLTVQINVSMAGYLQSVTVENEVLVWQNLLLGRVPDVNV